MKNILIWMLLICSVAMANENTKKRVTICYGVSKDVRIYLETREQLRRALYTNYLLGSSDSLATTVEYCRLIQEQIDHIGRRHESSLSEEGFKELTEDYLCMSYMIVMFEK